MVPNWYLRKHGVASRKDFLTVPFPFPVNADPVSHPVKVHQNASYVSSPCS